MDEAMALSGKTEEEILALAASKTTRSNYKNKGVPASLFKNELLAHWRQARPGATTAQELRQSPAPPRTAATSHALGGLEVLVKAGIKRTEIPYYAGIIVRLHVIRESSEVKFRQLEAIIDEYHGNAVTAGAGKPRRRLSAKPTDPKEPT